MKKYRLMAAWAISALALSACQEEQPLQVEPEGRVAVTIHAGMPETRTYIEYDGSAYVPYWHQGDALYVMVDEDYGTKKTFTNNAEDGRTGTFTGTLDAEDGTHTLTAFYPKAMNDGRSEQVFKFQLAENQVLPSLSTFDGDNDLLVAEPKELTVSGNTATVDGMRFRRLLGVVKVVLKDGTAEGILSALKVKGVKLSSSAALLTGRVCVDITTGEITEWEAKSSYKDVSATYGGDDWTFGGQGAAFLVVNPTTLAAGSDLSIEVTTDDETLAVTKRVTLPSDVVFAENKVTTLSFTFGDDNVSEAGEEQEIVWDFSTEPWQEAFAGYGDASTDITGWDITLSGLQLYSSKKSKYGTTYFQMGGAGSTSDRFFKFTAPSAGRLTVWSTNTGSSEATDRYVTVSNGGSTESVVGGAASDGLQSECGFDVKAGDVYIYPTGNGLRFYKIRFVYSESASGDDPDEPAESADLECTDPPTEGEVELDRMYGYAEAYGVTGGDGATEANILHFDTGKALQTWLLARTKSEKAGDHSPVTIWLSGTFGPEDGRDFSEAHPWFDVKDVSNLSFYGTDDFVMDRIGLFCVRATNIIIRNINFQQPKANNGADAVSMQACDGVWVDHCTFTSLNQTKDYEDGSTDVTHASKNVTVSWCHYIKTQKTCLVGHSNSATGDTEITVTFHHNWFDASSSRHPRVRYGKAHVYNNLFDGCTTYGVGSAYGAMVLSEYNYFDTVQLPTDICTYPAKDGDVSNLQGSVAGYLYSTENVYVNRPSKAKDPYPLTNVEYTAYGGTAVSPALTYADFKPDYTYVVTPAGDVPSVVRAGAGYGVLPGYSEAPVEVNNGGITDYDGTDDDPVDPDTGDEDDPASAATHTIYMNDSASVVVTGGSSYFTYSSSAADFRSASSTSYNGPFTIDGVTYQRGFKMDSSGYITFTTSSDYSSTLQFYYARRKEADTAACLQLVPTGGTATVFDVSPFDTYADSGAISLEKGTEYTVKQKTKEQGVILLIVTESE
mgnify:CR=1 FL=1